MTDINKMSNEPTNNIPSSNNIKNDTNANGTPKNNDDIKDSSENGTNIINSNKIISENNKTINDKNDESKTNQNAVNNASDKSDKNINNNVNNNKTDKNNNNNQYNTDNIINSDQNDNIPNGNNKNVNNITNNKLDNANMKRNGNNVQQQQQKGQQKGQQMNGNGKEYNNDNNSEKKLLETIMNPVPNIMKNGGGIEQKTAELILKKRLASPIDELIEKLVNLEGPDKTRRKRHHVPVQIRKKKDENVNKPSVGITAKNISNVCALCRLILISQPMLIEVNGPVKIVGDVHGQFYDLLRLFDLGGYPPEANYLFLGDYIDRGKHSLETIVLLFCYKIKHSQSFFLLRGNHECASINRIYGFYDECKRRFPKHGVKLWKIFTDCFNCLPVACLIDEKIFCMHGGLSPDLRSMAQIKQIERPTDVPDAGLICDLLWSDPEPGINGWGENDRGVSWTFGPNVLKKFLNRFDMDLICRAHQVVEDGYEFFGQRRLVTIFSAPNYCGEFDNAGAMMSVDDTLMCSFHIIKPNPAPKKRRFYN